MHTSRPPSNNHASFAMKSLWEEFKLESVPEGNFSSTVNRSTEVEKFTNTNSAVLEDVGKLKKSSTIFVLGLLKP